MSNSNMNQESISQSESKAKVVDFGAFKKKRDVKEEVARSRKPLYVNSSEGSISGMNPSQKQGKEDFAERLTKIRGSLDRINQLMTEIKKLSANGGDKSGNLDEAKK
jgi:hypothetical protein